MSKPKLSESPERQGIRETLKNIAIDAEQLGLDSFDPKQLAGLNVRLEHMDMNETSSSKPLYFAPYPDHQLPYAGDQLGGMEKEVGDDRWGREFDRHCYQLADVIQTNIDHSSYHFNEHNFPLAPWTSMEPGDYPYVAMDFGLEYRARYLTYEITDIDDTEHPHVKLIVRQGMDATDSTILRGELIPMVATMVVQSLRKRLLNHIVFPVLAISVIGKKVRFLEYYFDGKQLVIRHSKFFHFSNVCAEVPHRTVLRWWYGDPIGDTKASPRS